MNIKINLRGKPEADAKLQALTERIRNLNPLLQRIAVMELAQAQGRIEAGGPGWPPTSEQGKVTPLNRNGALLRSLMRGGDGNEFEEIPKGYRVGTNLQSGGWNIGRMMQYGTGVYGRGTPIVPTRAKALAFKIDGKKVFAKSVKGSPPRPFLYITDEDAKRAAEIAAAYIRGQEES